jgi:hypothetical protein
MVKYNATRDWNTVVVSLVYSNFGKQRFAGLFDVDVLSCNVTLLKPISLQQRETVLKNISWTSEI